MSSPIELGAYLITSYSQDRPLGRDYDDEDPGAFTRPIFYLPSGAEPSVFLVTSSDKQGSYVVWTDPPNSSPNPVDTYEDVLVSDYVPVTHPALWKFQAAPRYGPDVYLIILTKDSTKGWVVDDEAGDDKAQVKVAPLTYGPSYPQNQLFKLTPTERN